MVTSELFYMNTAGPAGHRGSRGSIPETAIVSPANASNLYLVIVYRTEAESDISSRLAKGKK